MCGLSSVKEIRIQIELTYVKSCTDMKTTFQTNEILNFSYLGHASHPIYFTLPIPRHKQFEFKKILKFIYGPFGSRV